MFPIPTTKSDTAWNESELTRPQTYKAKSTHASCDKLPGESYVRRDTAMTGTKSCRFGVILAWSVAQSVK